MGRIALSDSQYRQSILDRFGNPDEVVVLPGSYHGALRPLTYHCPVHGAQVVPRAGHWRGRCKLCSRAEVAAAQKYSKEDTQAKLDRHFGYRHLEVLSEPGDLGEGSTERRMRLRLRCTLHSWAPPFTRILYKIIGGLSDCPLCIAEQQYRQHLISKGLPPENVDRFVYARRELKQAEISLGGN